MPPVMDGCLTGKSVVNVLGIFLQGASGLGSFGSMGQLALPVIFIAAMYFLLIAPNQKKQKTWQAMLNALKAGDKVTTNGGLRGTVLQVKDDVVIDCRRNHRRSQELGNAARSTSLDAGNFDRKR